jgi:hypothetical protein
MFFPQVLGAWFKWVSTLITLPGGAIGPAAAMAKGMWPTLIGTGLGLLTLAALGVPMTPTVIGLGILGGVAGGTIATVVAVLLAGGPPGWIALAVIGTVSFITTLLGGWIGSLIDKSINRMISFFGLAINGIQALFELMLILRRGIGITNVLQLILAIGSIVATLNYMQTMNGTNACTTDDECLTIFDSESSVTPGGETDYLYYYDLNVISSESQYHQQNIQRVLSLLGDNPDFLNNTFGDKQKYIYIGNTTDTYVNEYVAIIAINKNDLYSNNDIGALINTSVALNTQ